MKNLDKWWEEVRYEVPKAKHPLQAWERFSHTAPYNVAEAVWREAYESIRNEIKRLRGDQKPISVLKVVAFIDEELNE